MTAPDAQLAFFNREGSYELCAALSEGPRSRQELIAMIDVPERTIDRRITEGKSLGLITPVPTTDTQRIVEFDDAPVSEDILEIIDLVLSCSRSENSQYKDDIQPKAGRLHREMVNEADISDMDTGVSNHANVSGGDSTFF